MKEISGVYLILINHLNNLILIFLSKNYFSIFILFYFFFLSFLFIYFFLKEKNISMYGIFHILYIFIYIMLKYTFNCLIINKNQFLPFWTPPNL